MKGIAAEAPSIKYLRDSATSLQGAAGTGDFTVMRCPVSNYIELKGRQARANILGSSSTIR